MLSHAKEIAKKLVKNQYKIAAIITDRKGNILSIGVNSYSKTHPRQAYYADKVGKSRKIFLHAEMDALIKCKGKPYAIYIARVNNKGEERLAAPCTICQMAIQDAGLKEVHYTVSDFEI